LITDLRDLTNLDDDVIREVVRSYLDDFAPPDKRERAYFWLAVGIFPLRDFREKIASCVDPDIWEKLSSALQDTRPMPYVDVCIGQGPPCFTS
jgi:hypothetical protein